MITLTKKGIVLFIVMAFALALPACGNKQTPNDVASLLPEETDKKQIQSTKIEPIDYDVVTGDNGMDIQEAIDNALILSNEFFSILEKYKLLRNADVLSIPDAELENAVMSWMWNKFNDDWSNQYQVVSTLPKPCQNVYSCRTVIDEVNNGGFNQLFFNQSSQFAEMSIDGFLALGSPKMSKIMEEAVALYKENKEALDKYNDGTLESFIDSYTEGIFSDLDDAFYAECDSINYVNYIRLNANYFGD